MKIVYKMHNTQRPVLTPQDIAGKNTKCHFNDTKSVREIQGNIISFFVLPRAVFLKMLVSFFAVNFFIRVFVFF